MITKVIAVGPYHLCQVTVYLPTCQVRSIDQHSKNMTIHPVSTSSRITYAATTGFLGERSTLCGVQCKKLPNEVESNLAIRSLSGTCIQSQSFLLLPAPCAMPKANRDVGSLCVEGGHILPSFRSRRGEVTNCLYFSFRVAVVAPSLPTLLAGCPLMPPTTEHCLCLNLLQWRCGRCLQPLLLGKSTCTAFVAALPLWGYMQFPTAAE